MDGGPEPRYAVWLAQWNYQYMSIPSKYTQYNPWFLSIRMVRRLSILAWSGEVRGGFRVQLQTTLGCGEGGLGVKRFGIRWVGVFYFYSCGARLCALWAV